MNRAFLIILIPALLVAAGYIAIFRLVGVGPGYARLAAAMALFFALIWWLGRRNKKTTRTGE